MKLLIIISFLFLFSCAEKVKQVQVPVPVKCKVPEIPQPKYQKPETDNPVELLKTLLQNYEMCLNYSNILKEAQKVCE
jgi:hypothetical protein